MIGERLFPTVSKYQPELAGKITGMILEMDNSELLILLNNEHQLKAKARKGALNMGTYMGHHLNGEESWK
eukprot:s379_g43.t1